MGAKKIFAFFCTLAYIIVLAHSAVPHNHHLHCEGESAEEHSCAHSMPHHGSCELLDTFLIEDDGDHCVASIGEMLPVRSEIPCEPACESSIFHHPEEVTGIADTPPLRVRTLRAPPVA